MKTILALIPARGGSKGIPKKNILPLLGHPLIAYSIKAAQQSTLINRIIVSTDSDAIAKIALQYGAEVPFMRPSEFAEDMSVDFEVFDHALQWLSKNEDYHPDLVVQMRPTSPVRTVNIIDDCIAKLDSSDADSIRTVIPCPETPYKMWRISDENLPMTPLLTLENEPEPYNQPRQKLPQIFWHVGVLDVIRSTTIREKRSISGNKILPYIIDNEIAVDIDEMSSFEKATEIISQSKKYVHFE